MGNNLNELNTLLFETLKGLKNGKIDIKQAHAVTSVANTIINSAKVQLDMYKMVKEKDVASVFFSPSNAVFKIEGSDTYERKTSYAKQLGYPSTVSAIAAVGSERFNNDFRKLEE